MMEELSQERRISEERRAHFEKRLDDLRHESEAREVRMREQYQQNVVARQLDASLKMEQSRGRVEHLREEHEQAIASVRDHDEMILEMQRKEDTVVLHSALREAEEHEKQHVENERLKSKIREITLRDALNTTHARERSELVLNETRIRGALEDELHVLRVEYDSERDKVASMKIGAQEMRASLEHEIEREREISREQSLDREKKDVSVNNSMHDTSVREHAQHRLEHQSAPTTSLRRAEMEMIERESAWKDEMARERLQREEDVVNRFKTEQRELHEKFSREQDLVTRERAEITRLMRLESDISREALSQRVTSEHTRALSSVKVEEATSRAEMLEHIVEKQRDDIRRIQSSNDERVDRLLAAREDILSNIRDREHALVENQQRVDHEILENAMQSAAEHERRAVESEIQKLRAEQSRVPSIKIHSRHETEEERSRLDTIESMLRSIVSKDSANKSCDQETVTTTTKESAAAGAHASSDEATALLRSLTASTEQLRSKIERMERNMTPTIGRSTSSAVSPPASSTDHNIGNGSTDRERRALFVETPSSVLNGRERLEDTSLISEIEEESEEPEAALLCLAEEGLASKRSIRSVADRHNLFDAAKEYRTLVQSSYGQRQAFHLNQMKRRRDAEQILERTKSSPYADVEKRTRRALSKEKLTIKTTAPSPPLSPIALRTSHALSGSLVQDMETYTNVLDSAYEQRHEYLLDAMKRRTKIDAMLREDEDDAAMFDKRTGVILSPTSARRRRRRDRFKNDNDISSTVSDYQSRLNLSLSQRQDYHLRFMKRREEVERILKQSGADKRIVDKSGEETIPLKKWSAYWTSVSDREKDTSMESDGICGSVVSGSLLRAESLLLHLDQSESSTRFDSLRSDAEAVSAYDRKLTRLLNSSKSGGGMDGERTSGDVVVEDGIDARSNGRGEDDAVRAHVQQEGVEDGEGEEDDHASFDTATSETIVLVDGDDGEREEDKTSDAGEMESVSPSLYRSLGVDYSFLAD